MTTVKQALIQVRDLVSDPTRWTKGTFARDADGHSVSSVSDTAVCYCVSGAAYKITRGSDVFLAVMNRLLAATTWHDTVGLYNDSLTHDQMLMWLDRAIANS